MAVTGRKKICVSQRFMATKLCSKRILRNEGEDITWKQKNIAGEKKRGKYQSVCKIQCG